MIALDIMLVGPAEEGGIKVPQDIDNYDRIDYPYWYVYTQLQLGRPMPSASSHWDNAKALGRLTIAEVQTLKGDEEGLAQIGFY